MHQPLLEKGLLIRRHEEFVDDNIVYKIRPHRGGKPKIIDLDRCRSVGKDCGSAGPSVAAEIDQDVDGVGMDQFGRYPVRHLDNVDEPIEGAVEARAYFAAVVGT